MIVLSSLARMLSSVVSSVALWDLMRSTEQTVSSTLRYQSRVSLVLQLELRRLELPPSLRCSSLTTFSLPLIKLSTRQPSSATGLVTSSIVASLPLGRRTVPSVTVHCITRSPQRPTLPTPLVSSLRFHALPFKPKAFSYRASAPTTHASSLSPKFYIVSLRRMSPSKTTKFLSAKLRSCKKAPMSPS